MNSDPRAKVRYDVAQAAMLAGEPQLPRAAVLSGALLPGPQTAAAFTAHRPRPACSLLTGAATASCALTADE